MYITEKELDKKLEEQQKAICNSIWNMLQSQQGSQPMHLDNCTDATQNAPEGGNPMAYERTRVFLGFDSFGKPVYTQVSGKTQDERNDNIVRKYIECGRIWDFLPVNMMQASDEKSCIAAKEMHSIDVVAWEWYNEHLPMRIQAGKTGDGVLSPYKTHLQKQILGYFGNTPIEHIKHRDVQEFLFSLVNPRTEEFYARGTIETVKSVLKQILDYAVSKEYLPENPMNKAPLLNPSDKKTIRMPLSKEELLSVRRMIPSLKEEKERLYMIMLAYLPYRRCEALGQKWEDIDFADKTCSVTGDVVIKNGKAVYQKGKAKNATSLRTMVAPTAMIEALKPYRKDIGFVLNTDGEHLKASEIDNLWKGITEQIPMLAEKGFTPYCFRHTIASVMYHGTNDLISVAAQCGHKTTRETSRTYVHDDMEHRRATIEKVEMALG